MYSIIILKVSVHNLYMYNLCTVDVNLCIIHLVLHKHCTSTNSGYTCTGTTCMYLHNLNYIYLDS